MFLMGVTYYDGLCYRINVYMQKLDRRKELKNKASDTIPNGPELTSVSTVKPREDKARPVDPVVTKFTRLKKLKLSFTNFIIDA